MTRAIKTTDGMPTKVVAQTSSEPSKDWRTERIDRLIIVHSSRIITTATASLLYALIAFYFLDQLTCRTSESSTRKYLTIEMAQEKINGLGVMHIYLIGLSALIDIIAIVKSKYNRRFSDLAYLLLMNFATFIGLILAAYITYMSFYSPCKQLLSLLDAGTEPAESILLDKRVSNVLEEEYEDREYKIFSMELINLIIYSASFIQSILSLSKLLIINDIANDTS